MDAICCDFSGTNPPPDPPVSRDDEYPLDPGTYIVRITGVESKTSPESGKWYLSWQLTPMYKVVDGRGGPTRRAIASRERRKKLYHVTSLEPEGLWKVRDFIKAVTGLDISGTVRFDPEQFIGKRIIVIVKMYHYGPGAYPSAMVSHVKQYNL